MQIGAAATIYNFVAITLNNHMINPYQPPETGRPHWHRFDEVDHPAQTVLSLECWVACVNNGSFPQSTLRGTLQTKWWYGYVGHFARHYAEGLNFGCVDGHSAFHEYRRLPGGGGIFLGPPLTLDP